MRNTATPEAKKPVKNGALNKPRVTSIVRFMMSRHFLFLIAAIFLIGIAACSKPDEQGTNEHGADEQGTPSNSTSQIEPEKQDISEAATGPDLLETLRDNAGVVDAQDRAIIVERARNNAKEAALAVGQSEAQAEDAAQAAALSAQNSLKAREIP